MNKVIIAIIVIVVLGGGFFLYKSQQDAAMKAKEDVVMVKEEGAGEETSEHETMEKKNAAMENGEDTMVKNGSSRYVEYSKAVLDQAADKRRVLYFYANWCPTCKPANADLQENSSKIPEDMVVIRVNYNDSDTDQEEKDLAKKYGITYQHTFVQIDEQGKEVTKWNGGQTDELLANIK